MILRNHCEPADVTMLVLKPESREVEGPSPNDRSIKTARTKKEAAYTFCPFAPVESFLAAKVSIREHGYRGDIDPVVT